MKLSNKFQSNELFQSETGPNGWLLKHWKKLKEKQILEYTQSRFKLSNSSRTDDDVHEGFEDIQDVNMKQSQKLTSVKAWIEMKKDLYSVELCKMMMKKLLMLTVINFLTGSSTEHIFISYLNSK